MNMKLRFCCSGCTGLWSAFHNSDGLHADTTTTVKLVILSPSTGHIKSDSVLFPPRARESPERPPGDPPSDAGIIPTVSPLITNYTEKSCKQSAIRIWNRISNVRISYSRQGPDCWAQLMNYQTRPWYLWLAPPDSGVFSQARRRFPSSYG